MFVLDLALNRLESDPASLVPDGSVSSLNTHDTPPLAGQIHGNDIENRVRPGQVSQALEPALRLLGISPARFVIVSVDNLLGVREPQYVPGTTTEHPNWRRRSPLAIESLESDDSVREILLALDVARRNAPGEDG
jgi:4-alpha-glucanotransferase